nr:hypothetical protein BaRGS_030195 [Batillaria attramentaria]
MVKPKQCCKQNLLKVGFDEETLSDLFRISQSTVLNGMAYSYCKGHTTYKSLVGISPDGTIVFVSSLYTGSISDKDITARSSLLDLLEEGDEVMVDKGFPIQDLLMKKKASLVIPPFLGKSCAIADPRLE